MTKITREQLLEYIELANKEYEHVKEHTELAVSQNKKINVAIVQRRYVVVHLLKRLRELERTKQPTVFIDFKDEETLNGYKVYLDSEDNTLTVLKAVNKK